MDLITPKDLVNAAPVLKIFGGESLARLIYRFLKFDKVNGVYVNHGHLPGPAFIDEVLRVLDVGFDLPKADLANIPSKGGFITVSNHAYGGIDGIILLKIFPGVREDFRVIVNFLLTKLDPLKPYFLGVNPFETHKDLKSSFGGLKDAFIHLHNGHPIGIFPAGEVATYQFQNGYITDKEWQHSILKFIRKANVPVVPVYFDGNNSKFFHFLGMIHPALRTARLPAEMFNKRTKVIRVRVGHPIPVWDQEIFRDIGEFGKYLRMRTYSLGIPFQRKKRSFNLTFSSPDKIIDPVPVQFMEEEISGLGKEHHLFSLGGAHIYCAPTAMLPNIMREVGRLREIAFREVGEGTGKQIDTDGFDASFEQLFLWDESGKRIIGGYRVGKGEKLMENSGIRGFYIESLFRIHEKFGEVLRLSIELGRSFVVKDYQKKALSLFLLWKGILYLLLKHPGYRYLIGPVSIPNAFSDLSKSLAVDFLKRNYFNSEFAEYIKPRKKFKPTSDRGIDMGLFHKYTEKNLNRLDSFIRDFDRNYKTPVLIKKYISVNAEIMGFNIDPMFNNCLDALMILDVFEVPFKTIESLSKEINDHSIMERFRK